MQHQETNMPFRQFFNSIHNVKHQKNTEHQHKRNGHSQLKRPIFNLTTTKSQTIGPHSAYKMRVVYALIYLFIFQLVNFFKMQNHFCDAYKKNHFNLLFYFECLKLFLNDCLLTAVQFTIENCFSLSYLFLRLTNVTFFNCFLFQFANSGTYFTRNRKTVYFDLIAFFPLGFHIPDLNLLFYKIIGAK